MKSVENKALQPNMEEMLNLCDDVKEVCLPMFLFLSIRLFRIVRSYPDNSKFILCSNGFWLRQYFEEEFYDMELANYHKFPEGAEGINIHRINSSEDPIIQYWSRLGPHCDYNTILGVFKKTDDYLEYINFCLSQDTFVAQNIFLNNQKLFTHFIQYFYSEARHLMEKAYQHRFKVSEVKDFEFKQNWTIGLDREYQSKVIEKMPLKELFVGDNLTTQALSKEEIKIILLWAKGYEKKEIIKQEGIDKKELGEILTSVLAKLNLSSEKEIKKEIIKRKLLPKLMLLK